MRKIKGVVLNLQLPPNGIPRTAPDKDDGTLDMCP